MAGLYRRKNKKLPPTKPSDFAFYVAIWGWKDEQNHRMGRLWEIIDGPFPSSQAASEAAEKHRKDGEANCAAIKAPYVSPAGRNWFPVYAKPWPRPIPEPWPLPLGR